MRAREGKENHIERGKRLIQTDKNKNKRTKKGVRDNERVKKR